MFFVDRRSFLNLPKQSRRRPPSLSLRCEEPEPRLHLSVTPFFFSTGGPDARIGSRSEPGNVHNSNVEFETADDFILPVQTELDQATFTGLLTGGATTIDISNVNIEIYQVFPKDSNTARTPIVPTRANSPADVALLARESSVNTLSFTTDVLSPSFTIANSVASPAQIAVGGASTAVPTSGEEIRFSVAFTPPARPGPRPLFLSTAGRALGHSACQLGLPVAIRSAADQAAAHTNITRLASLGTGRPPPWHRTGCGWAPT
jgi:hypothetical protein